MLDDVPEEWVSVVALALGHTPHNRDTIRAAIAAVAPLIRAAERDACMLIAEFLGGDEIEPVLIAIRARGADDGR